MKWLPPTPETFREDLAAIAGVTDTAARIGGLARLAATDLSFMRIVQVSGALAKTAPDRVPGFEDQRLAILAGGTVTHLQPPVRVAGLRHGLRIETAVSGYGQYRQDLLDPRSEIRAFRPDTILFSLIARDFLGAVPVDASAEAADRAIDAAVEDIRGLWSQARTIAGCVIQQSFLDTEPPLFGSLDSLVPGAPARLVARLNMALAEAAKDSSVLWLELSRAVARDGLDVWHDEGLWFQAKMAIAPTASGIYGELVARLIAAARGKSRKCLVLDLDNTLWGGVIGDDGIEGIVLGEGSAIGEAHLALQRHALRLRARGVILAVCSKNDPAIAEAALRDHPEMLLRRDHFASFVANWTDKASNLEAIARELNIGVEALVFVDDNPVERAQVRDRLPMVAVPELPKDPAQYVRVLADAGYFEATSFTAEDRSRADLYAANSERAQFEEAAGGIGGFLDQLDMAVEFGPVTPLTRPRVTQLINKTNQFNTTTLRRSEAEIDALASLPGALTLWFRLADKFGDNGIVSVMLLIPDGPATLRIDTWVMSCRVFGRQLEDEAMNILVELARARGIATLRADFIPSAKNAVVADLYPRLGFSRDNAPDLPDGASRWSIRIADHVPRSTSIARKELVHD